MSKVHNGGMVVPPNNVVSAVFNSAVSAFNSRNWSALSGLLDENVIANTVHSGGVVSGRADVISYLMSDVDKTTSAGGKDDPHFQVSSLVAGGGHATGSGCWTDPVPSVVRFDFRITDSRTIDRMAAPEIPGRSCTSA